jgi:hypothetical protein
MRHISQARQAFAALPLCIATCTANASTFCVSDITELTDALAQASSNNANDTIRLRIGNYAVPFPMFSLGLRYQSDADFDLHLSGNWTGLNGACTRQFSDPHDTVVSGSGLLAALRMEMTGSAGDLVIDRLSFADGHSNPNTPGAGLYIGGANYSGSVVIDRVYFDDNVSEWIGAGLYVTTEGGLSLSNSLFRSNSCRQGGCAASLFVNHTDSIDLRGNIFNNTVFGNSCDEQPGDDCDAGGFVIGGTGLLRAHSNLFALNDGYDLQLLSDVVIVRNNNINSLGGIPQVSNANLNVINPQFVDYLAHDFHLQSTSPMRNAGLMSAGSPDRDFEGKPRFSEGQADIGAFEYQALLADGFEDDE